MQAGSALTSAATAPYSDFAKLPSAIPPAAVQVVLSVAPRVVRRVASPVAPEIACPVVPSVACPAALGAAWPIARPVAAPVALRVARTVAARVAREVALLTASPVAPRIALRVAWRIASQVAPPVFYPIVGTAMSAVGSDTSTDPPNRITSFDSAAQMPVSRPVGVNASRTPSGCRLSAVSRKLASTLRCLSTPSGARRSSRCTRSLARKRVVRGPGAFAVAVARVLHAANDV
jgi:hypothetical protein